MIAFQIIESYGSEVFMQSSKPSYIFLHKKDADAYCKNMTREFGGGYQYQFTVKEITIYESIEGFDFT